MTEAGQTEPELKGIGGWLLLPLVQLVVSPIWAFVNVVKFVSAVLHADSHPIASGLYLLAAVGIVFVVYAVFCLVRFTQAKKTVPFLMIGFYGLPVLEWAIGLSVFGQELLLLGLRLVVAVIWISYFFLSRRVKNTFVN